MALALVATRGHAQPSAGHLYGPVGGYRGPLPDPRAASRPCPAADWQPVCGSGGRHANTGQCRINYLEACRELPPHYYYLQTLGNARPAQPLVRGVLCHLSLMHTGKGNTDRCTRSTASAFSGEHHPRRSHATRGYMSERILEMRSYQNDSCLTHPQVRSRVSRTPTVCGCMVVWSRLGGCA